MRATRWMSVLGLSLALSGCDLFNPDPDSVGVGGYCRETAQCIDDLLCIDFACFDPGGDSGGGTSGDGTSGGGTSGGGDDTGAPDNGACLPLGEFCSTNILCCSGICLPGEQVCARSCTDDEDCATGCCVSVLGTGMACAPASACAQ